MDHSSAVVSELRQLLQPETLLENQLLETQEFQEGLLWGKPRFGHPEGTVALHVREILRNFDDFDLQPDYREQLRLIAYAHDTFKYREVREAPRDWDKHHAVLARRFMESFTSDEVVLRIIELHDEAFYIWRRWFLQKQTELAKRQLQELFDRLGGMTELYYIFFYSDTRTGDKLQAPLAWFEQMMRDRGFDPSDITR